MLMSASQAAKFLGVSLETVRRRIRSGDWPIYKIGPKSIRLDVDEIKTLGRISATKEEESQTA